MIRKLRGSEKTNSFRPGSWCLTEEPFPAFRAGGQDYTAFFAVSRDFQAWFHDGVDPRPSRIIKTKKGGWLLVPCDHQHDEKILLVTAVGNLRGHFSRVEVHGGEILYHRGSTKHCVPVEHLVVRITEPNGYLLTEGGRRCGYGECEVYSWDYGYRYFQTQEYEAALETGQMFVGQPDVQAKIEACYPVMEAEKQSRQLKPQLIARLEEVNRLRQERRLWSLSFEESYFLDTDHLSHYYDEQAVVAEEKKLAADIARQEKQQALDDLIKRVRAADLGFKVDVSTYDASISVRDANYATHSYQLSEAGWAQLQADAEQLRLLIKQ